MKIYRLFYKFIFIFLISIFSFNYVFANVSFPLNTSIDISEFMQDKSFIETSSNFSKLPNINSRAYIVIDRKSNFVLLGKNENQKRKMASTTKIMTALIVIENSDLNNLVKISKKAASTGGSRLGLKTDDKITVLDLLYGLMLCSGNDAAVALAEYISGSIPNFAELMNNKAKNMGLLNTHFVTPHGLDADEHYTTAYELAILANYAMKNEIFAKIVGTKNYTINLNGYPKNIHNTNELLGSLNGVYGIKTGFTNGANRCLVTCCKRGDLDILCVVLGADTKKFRTTDSIKLIEYTFENFTNVNIKDIIDTNFNFWKTEVLNSFIINKGTSNFIDLTYEEIEYPVIPIKSDLINKIHFIVSFNNKYNAPISQNTPIGSLTLLLNKEILYSGNILIKNPISQKSVLDYMCYFFKNFEKIFSAPKFM